METKNVKILMIEDVQITAELIGFRLVEDGFSDLKICTVQNAEGVLKKGEFDVVILNWELDDNPAGFALLDFVSDSTKVILMSLYTTDWIYPLEKHSRVNAFVWKIRYNEELGEVIKKLVCDLGFEEIERGIKNGESSEFESVKDFLVDLGKN